MAGLFGLSIDSRVYRGNFLDELFFGTFYLQHLGEEYAGLSSYDPGREGSEEIKIRTHRGLFRPTFVNDLAGLEGTEGIGYCGHAREPYSIYTRLGKLSLCFSGNIINLPELVERFKASGHGFEREDDVEGVSKLLAQDGNMVEAIKKMDRQIEGAYCILILTKEGICAVRGSTGHWPLVIGEKEGATIVASESGGFNNLGFELIRDIEPGEIVFLKEGRWITKGKMPSERVQICSFLWVYTAFPNSVLEGIPVSLVRERLGAALARRDIENGFIPDIVVPVPDSGRFHAIGYNGEFCRQLMARNIDRCPLYNEVLLKDPYAGRSYTLQDAEVRSLEARLKILPSGEDYRGKKVVVCDDSIVRGTQMQTGLVPKLRVPGIEEVHLRISNPELCSHCPWGKTTEREELLAVRLPRIEDRIKSLGVESLVYNTIDVLVEAIGLPRDMLCVDCSLDLE